ncbi:hypothetical protein [Myxococcus stipitatus]|uniref:hypothetical protein n=1 Tax=Myxococcus stipitatus TaxID=83455 RepID=UPI0030D2362D
MKIGPKLEHLGGGWIPQGQGYDASRNEFLTTYYQNNSVQLSVQNKGSGKETKLAKLGGTPLDPKNEVPKHGGGVATDGRFVYVSDTKNIFVYTRADIEKAKSGAQVHAIQKLPVNTPSNPPDKEKDKKYKEYKVAGSFIAVKDGYAYVGAFSGTGENKGAVSRYKIDPLTGKIFNQSRTGPIEAPKRAQGIAVVNGALLFTTGEKKLIYQPITSTADSFQANTSARKDISNKKIGPYAQGINVIGNELWVTYESGAKKYKNKLKSPYTPHEYIVGIPLNLLDLKAAGITP